MHNTAVQRLAGVLILKTDWKSGKRTAYCSHSSFSLAVSINKTKALYFKAIGISYRKDSTRCKYNSLPSLFFLHLDRMLAIAKKGRKWTLLSKRTCLLVMTILLSLMYCLASQMPQNIELPRFELPRLHCIISLVKMLKCMLDTVCNVMCLEKYNNYNNPASSSQKYSIHYIFQDTTLILPHLPWKQDPCIYERLTSDITNNFVNWNRWLFIDSTNNYNYVCMSTIPTTHTGSLLKRGVIIDFVILQVKLFSLNRYSNKGGKLQVSFYPELRWTGR